MDFYYLDQHYTEVIVSVNGVVRAGVPGTPIVLCPNDTPQNIPSADNPFHFSDNLLAPFWADLDLTGGNMYLVLTIHNGKPHTVIEWENVLVIQTNKRVSFQLWFEDGTDNIWFAYPDGFNGAVGITNPTATIGAENEAGNEAAKYYYNGTGTLPTGAVDVWVGLEPTTATLGFKANATAPAGSNITNEATVTVSSTTNTAWANTRICGAATATQPGIAIQALHYTLTEWAGSPYNSYQLWRATVPYFTPDAGGSIKVYDGKASGFVDKVSGPTVGDPATNYYYVLRTTNCAGTSSADSYPVAEFDFSLKPGE
jgi:hypothetical protein